MKSLTITEYFVGQSIFITGGTGTLGKILVEKILRCCPGVARIYLMMREKKHTTIEERWKKITDLALFDVLKASNPKSLDKIILISGDLRSENMGLTEEDKQSLIENVTIIYHLAAMIQFTDSITLALTSNTKATHRLLDFARSVKKLQLFLHVSTAFCNMNIPCEKAVEEVIPATIDWRVVLKLLETQPLELEAIREKLLCGHPNPYTWSKWLAEQIVNEYSIHFPTVITRPAAVAPTIRHPFPGWLDSIDGIYAITHAIGFGILRIAYTKWDSYQDYIPADAAINAIIVASWKKYKEPAPGHTDVYNCGLVKDIPVNTKDYHVFGKSIMESSPSKYIVWPMHLFITSNDLLYKILFLLLQALPAALLDLVNLVRRKKTRVMKLTIKLANGFRIFKKFSAAQLGFPNEKYKALNDIIPNEDRDSFRTEYQGLTNKDLQILAYESVRKYYFKEEINEENMIKNRKRYFWLKLTDEVLIFAIWMAGCLMLSKVIGSFLPF